MFFSNQGILPTIVMADNPEIHFRFSILTLHDSMGLIWIVHIALLSSLHIGVGIVMGLTSFALMMMTLYMLFLKAEDADKITQCVKKALERAIPRKVSIQAADQSIV